MGYIDKIYTNSYNKYKEFKEWANKQYVTFYNGHTMCIGDEIWNLNEEDFKNDEIAIANTPIWVDIYLIQNCKMQFILDRMKEIYTKETYKKFQTIDITFKPNDDFKQNRKIVIKKAKSNSFPIHEKPYGKFKWKLRCDDKFSYCEKTKVWSSDENYYPKNTNTMEIKSIESVVRYLRTQYLPKGITFKLYGEYINEDYLIEIR